MPNIEVYDSGFIRVDGFEWVIFRLDDWSPDSAACGCDFGMSWIHVASA